MKCKLEKCTNEMPKIEIGRRPKEYCSSSCRQKDYRLRRESEISNLKAEIERLKSQKEVKEVLQPVKEQEKEIFLNPNEEILNRIKAISAEKMPSHIATSLGKQTWINDKNKKIIQLVSQLK